MSDDTRSTLSVIPEGFYDLLGILFPGISLNALLAGLKMPLFSAKIPGNIFELLSFLLVSYILGHLLYSASTILLPRLAGWLTQDPRLQMLHPKQDDGYPLAELFAITGNAGNELTRRIRQKWKLPSSFPTTVALYELCRNYVHVKDKERANFIRKEMAYGELARSLVLVCFIGLSLVWFSPLRRERITLYAVLLFGSMLVFFWRYLHAREINAALVYFNFLVLRGEEVEREGQDAGSKSLNLDTGAINMHEVKKEQFQLINEDDMPTRITQWAPEVDASMPVVIFVPGLKGFTNWGSFPYVCEELARKGNVVLSLGFSRDGVEGYESEITRIDLAVENSPRLEVEECRNVIKAIRDGNLRYANRMNAKNIFLLGHSLGGAVVFRVADLERSSVRGIVTWSSISHLDLWPDEVKKKWEMDGRLNMPNARTGQDFFLGQDFLVDVRDEENFDQRKVIKRISCPVLIAHGTADDSVPRSQAEELFESIGPERGELFWVDGGDHNFGAVHPFAGSTPELNKAIEKTADWISSHRA